MSGPSAVTETPIKDRAELVEFIADGGKPISDWRIGTEHEKFGFRLDDLRPPTFEGERGIATLLKNPTITSPMNSAPKTSTAASAP